MRQSRYIWLSLIALVCLVGITTWQTPKAVMTSLLDPEYSDSPQIAIQHFWRYLDNRQLDLANGLFFQPAAAMSRQELAAWQDMMAKDPLISLQRVEFINTGTTGTIQTRVYWTARTNNIFTATYDFELTKTSQGWRIKRFTKV